MSQQPGVDVGLTELRVERTGPRRLYRSGTLTNLVPQAQASVNSFGFAFQCPIFRVYWFAVRDLQVTVNGSTIPRHSIHLVINGGERSVDALKTLDFVSFIGDHLGIIVYNAELKTNHDYSLEVKAFPSGD